MSTESVRAGERAVPRADAARALWARSVGRLDVARARILAIVIGGAAGTLARAGLAEAIPHSGRQWPWATFIVNLAGALILGWLLTRLAERTAPSRYWRFLAGTGFCGALTTFSTFQIETFQFARAGHPGLAVAYPAVSIAAGMVVAAGGVLLARWGRHW